MMIFSSRFLYISIAILLSSLSLVSSPNDAPDNMVLVKGGSFRMGTAKKVTDEEPIHEVTLNSFYIGKYEVTQAEWNAVMENNPSLYKDDNLPVETVTWYDAVEFCNKKSQKEGLTPCYSGQGDDIACDFKADGYRLLTEAEWEYACRGGLKTRNYRFSGSNNIQEVTWYRDNSEAKTQPVGRLKPNELGIYDMSGNAWEWCWDWYDADYYKNSPSHNPTGPATGKNRVYRGGGAGGYYYWMRSTGRYSYIPQQKHWFIGFRVMRNDTGILKSNPPKDMIFVKAGTFKMGGNQGIKGEKLVHRVTLDSFYIGKYEVTQQEWTAIMGNNPAAFRCAKIPIHSIDWNKAVEYCNKRSRMEGLTPCYTGSQDRVTCNFDAEGYRLPTEAEWEYAARGGLKSRHYLYSGSDDANEVGWNSDNSEGRPRPQGLKKPNELEIYDMSGNVYEWCWDWYAFDYIKNPSTNPRGPLSGVGRVLRGGSYFYQESETASTSRFHYEPFRENYHVGFRLVRTVK